MLYFLSLKYFQSLGYVAMCKSYFDNWSSFQFPIIWRVFQSLFHMSWPPSQISGIWHEIKSLSLASLSVSITNWEAAEIGPSSPSATSYEWHVSLSTAYALPIWLSYQLWVLILSFSLINDKEEMSSMILNDKSNLQGKLSLSYAATQLSSSVVCTGLPYTPRVWCSS